ncbi:MAG: P-type conjugative transfer protein VirB9, partial [Pseudomonadota bacterium]
MINKFLNFFLTFILVLSVNNVSYASISPVPIATDARIKTVLYSPNEIIKYTGYYNFQSSIVFADDETIGTISLGFSGAWQLNPVGNRLFIKPVEQDATTNMTLITNKHVYFFELHASEAKDISDKNISYEVRIVYPSEETSGASFHPLDRVPDLQSEDLNKYNFRYTVSGSEDITPLRIFDDGEFTYFQFHDINGEIPAFFLVNKEGDESIINYRTRGPYIVVERVTSRYTLRHGKSVVCVFNEAK